MHLKKVIALALLAVATACNKGETGGEQAAKADARGLCIEWEQGKMEYSVL